MIDILFEFEAKIEKLQICRNQMKYRQTGSEYGYYLVKEIFKSRYAMQIMWNKLMEYANEMYPSAYSEALTQLEKIYNQTVKEKVADNLESWFESTPSEWVGAIHYEGFVRLIQDCKNGDRTAREEIEFSYLYYTLSDLCTRKWAAICASGIGKLEAVQSITGCRIEPIPLNDYKVLTNGLGQLYVSKFLEEHYTPFP